MDASYRMNVAAVKKVDPSMNSILDSATHVAMYTFNSKDNKWEKTDIEGAMFLYSRSTVPNHAFIIMNRLSTTNLVEPVNAGLDFQIKEPFLLYKTNQSLIYGIWFYDKNECYRVTSNLEKLVKSLQVKNPQKEKRKDGVGGVDIFSMLSKAQEDFNTRSKPEKADGNHSADGAVQQTASVGVMRGLPTPPNPHVPTHTPQSVMDFFAKASNSQFPNPEHEAHKVMKPPPTILPAFFQQPPPPLAHPLPMQQQQQGEDNMKPLLMRLMSNPVHSVEHIEKQQRSLTPDSKTDPQNTMLENGIKFLHMSAPPASAALFGTPPSSSILIAPVDHQMSSPLDLPVPQQQPALIPPVMFTTPARPDHDTSRSKRLCSLESTLDRTMGYSLSSYGVFSFLSVFPS